MPFVEPIGTPEVAARLRATRLALKLSQAALCRLAGISVQSWNNAETGDSRIGVNQAIKLCKATGVTLDWIYRGIWTGLPTGIAEAIARIDRDPALAGGIRSPETAPNPKLGLPRPD